MPELTIDPFVDTKSEVETDHQLITETLAGSRESLTALVERHQPWIYNLAFRMVLTPEDAEDVTQEVLVKLITKLSSFDPAKAKFRTWLYRVVTNHVLNMKKRGAEQGVSDFDAYYGGILSVPDQNLDASPENQAMIEDLKAGCVQGVLLCLERKVRLVFILSVGFRVTDVQGSEILDLSRENFRKILSRARARLHQYMSGNCGVINEEAPCRCRKKIKGFIDAGWKTADRLVYAAPRQPKLREVLQQRVETVGDELHTEFVSLFGDHPFYQAPEITEWLRQLLERPDFKQAFLIDEGGST